MAIDLNNITAFDYLEAARRLNLIMRAKAKTGKMTTAWFIDMTKAQARNFEFIEGLLTNEIAERNDVPEAFIKELDRKIDAELQKQDGSRIKTSTGNLVHVNFGRRPNTGDRDE